jgi:hypothetical protein
MLVTCAGADWLLVDALLAGDAELHPAARGYLIDYKQPQALEIIAAD